MISFWCAVGESIHLIFALIRIVLLLYFLESQGTSSLVGSEPKNNSSPPEYSRTLTDTRVVVIQAQTGARDLIKSWCSAYAHSDPERLAAFEMNDVETVDRFGDWHHLTGLQDRQRFWQSGFDMIRSRDFRPQCIIEHVRLIRPDVAIVQARISYDQGIGLNGSDRIPPFSEIHTFVLMKSDDTWLISAQDMCTFLWSERQERNNSCSPTRAA